VGTRRRWLGGLALVLALGVMGGVLTQPPALRPPAAAAVDPGEDPAAYLEARENRVRARYGIVEGTAKRIRWSGEPGHRTETVVVYLHGFSATRQEIAPIPGRVARALGANLFETRLAGHGLMREPLGAVSAEAWLEDGIEALAIARALGDRIIVIGVSTGATLALALARHPLFESIDSLVFVSPNWGVAAQGAERLIGPYGPQLARLIGGTERRWTAANEQQERFWTTRYPTAAVIEMMRLVALASDLTTEASVANALLIYSPADDVVSVPALLDGFERLPAARKEIAVIDEPRSLSAHVLAGDILGPAETGPTVERIVAFLQPAS